MRQQEKAGEEEGGGKDAPVPRAVDQVLEQLASCGEFEHEVVLARALVPLDRLDDVRVLELEERVLPKDLLLVVADALLGDDLDGDLDGVTECVERVAAMHRARGGREP